MREVVRHRRTGAVGTVHLWDYDPREPESSVGEVRWPSLFSTDELELARFEVDLVERDGAPVTSLVVLDGCVVAVPDGAACEAKQ